MIEKFIQKLLEKLAPRQSERSRLCKQIRALTRRIAGNGDSIVDGPAFMICHDGKGHLILYMPYDHQCGVKLTDSIVYEEWPQSGWKRGTVEYHWHIEILRTALDRLQNYAPLDAIELGIE